MYKPVKALIISVGCYFIYRNSIGTMTYNYVKEQKFC